MKNPWTDLPSTEPMILQEDQSAVEAFNRHYQGREDLTVQTDLQPEPFFGNVDAPVYVLILNPGFSETDRAWHAREDFVSSIQRARTHETMDYPHYYFDPRFVDSPGAQWWRQKTRRLIEDCGLHAVASGTFCIELFPYHSKRYHPIPRRYSANGLVPSSAYSAYLLRQAIQRKKHVVVMRAMKQWCSLVPELATYDRTIRLNSPQNVCLSPGNMTNYDDLVTALKESV